MRLVWTTGARRWRGGARPLHNAASSAGAARAASTRPTPPRKYEARTALAHRRRLDTVALYDRAIARVARVPRFSSRIGRMLPDALAPCARLARRRRGLNWRQLTSRVLDAWTPLGPGNIGGRTRVVRFHPTRPDTLFAAGVSGGIWRSRRCGRGSWRPIGDGHAQHRRQLAGHRSAQPRRDVRRHWRRATCARRFAAPGCRCAAAGIFVTRDGGATWQRLASTATQRLSLGQRSRARHRRQPAGLRRDAHRRLAIARRGDIVDAAARDQRARRLPRAGHSAGSRGRHAVCVVRICTNRRRCTASARQRERRRSRPC